MSGQNLFHDLMSRYKDGIAVVAIAAHEFGHIAQFRTGVDQHLLDGQSTVKRVELHADFLSGYFLGRRKIEYPAMRLWSAGYTLYTIGDYAFNDRDHHGTPDERTKAAEAGFAHAVERRLAYHDAFSAGVQFVLEQFS